LFASLANVLGIKGYTMSMPVFKLSKLVRDKLVDQYISDGHKPLLRKLSTEEHKAELINKIIEETKELAKVETYKAASEIADIQQAIDDLVEAYGLSSEDIRVAQTAKFDKAGGFKDGTFIETLEVPDGDKWADYYRSDPERFPEIR
jgi:predicted house-cleaning noncanonical NTP pyrophosphatase (MazG superfamily)